ncbi:sugar ABC transporter substrate-binding protein [Frondihabitans sp. PAMC 28766]|uniref:ABC transporter substrate-binding protein n=1 Tax=Frondihabitans sp. PAMC 28766 TaxID=1795630 RepID=UPI00078C2847|nr:extracellular solute-binding protein [Frondihabitans sp. PAMC 28766]AMM22539.1 sugar ABC transporter substrate-binding protein [Frondihabitans sp. PAMC 28766]
MPNNITGSAFSRRAFLGGAVGAGAVAFLAACSSSGGSGSSSKSLKFWNMPWGNTTFNTLDKTITTGYKPTGSLPSATYQVIQWANFTQTFSSAIASNTGPAVSSGGGTQAFQFAAQNKIAYADDLLDSWKKNGIYDDFLPGLIDTMKTDKGYAAIPYNLDMRVSWYSKSLLAKAGVQPPTDWQSYLDVCAALKKIGVYGWGQGSGSGNFTGSHIMVSFMINNGGGLFDENQKANCVTSANIEAIDFMLELVSKGYTDPASATYTSANVQAQWKAEKFGFGWDGAALDQNVGGTKAADLFVGDPLTGPSGKKGALFFPNNIMMYKNTPSQKGSEAFLTYYYKNMSPLWTKNTGVGLPVLKSIADTAGFKANKNAVKVISDWQPISKTWAAPGGSALFEGVTAVDGTPAMTTFTQSILGGKVTAKDALTTLQNAIKAS